METFDPVWHLPGTGESMLIFQVFVCLHLSFDKALCEVEREAAIHASFHYWFKTVSRWFVARLVVLGCPVLFDRCATCFRVASAQNGQKVERKCYKWMCHRRHVSGRSIIPHKLVPVVCREQVLCFGEHNRLAECLGHRLCAVFCWPSGCSIENGSIECIVRRCFQCSILPPNDILIWRHFVCQDDSELREHAN